MNNCTLEEGYETFSDDFWTVMRTSYSYEYSFSHIDWSQDEMDACFGTCSDCAGAEDGCDGACLGSVRDKFLGFVCDTSTDAPDYDVLSGWESGYCGGGSEQWLTEIESRADCWEACEGALGSYSLVSASYWLCGYQRLKADPFRDSLALFRQCFLGACRGEAQQTRLVQN